MTEQNGTKAPQDKVCGYEYTVKRGDSFYLIAHRLGVPLRDLLEANRDVNPARLMVGDVLCIPMEEDDRPPVETPAPTPTPTPPPAPAPAQPETAPEPEQPNTAEPEDDAMDSLDQPAAPEETAQTPAPETPAPEASCANGVQHLVAEGETISDIQIQAGLNLHTLEAANPDADLTRVQAGQVLCVPRENIPCDSPITYTLRTDETLESAALRLNVSVGSLLRANPCLAPADFVGGVCIVIPQREE